MSLEGFPVVVRLPVLWSDQDLYGHVNNVVYLRWFECSRVAYWDETGMRDVMRKTGRSPILVSVRCEFRQQVNFPDTVHIGGRTKALGRTSMTMEHQIHSERHNGIVAEGESVMVLFDYDRQQKDELPAELREVIRNAEASAGRSVGG